jgi:hypothetical protein
MLKVRRDLASSAVPWKNPWNLRGILEERVRPLAINATANWRSSANWTITSRADWLPGAFSNGGYSNKRLPGAFSDGGYSYKRLPGTNFGATARFEGLRGAKIRERLIEEWRSSDEFRSAGIARQQSSDEVQ